MKEPLKCMKCGDALLQNEIATGKQKCIHCLLRGYKRALYNCHKKEKQLENEIKQLKLLVPKRQTKRN